MRAMLRAALQATVLAAMLAACGGGGGGNGGGSSGGVTDPGTPAASPALVFSPSTVSATVNAGTSLTLNVIAAVQRPADFSGATTIVANLIDATGVIQPTVQLIRDSDLQYHAVLQTAATLAAGAHSGNFTVKLCRDSACASQFPGSPMLLPYNLQVVAAGVPTFTATSALPLTATAHLGGAAPATVAVAIVADGRTWTANAGAAAWLKLGATSGSGNATLTVGYDAGNLAVGVYATTLTVTASDGQVATLPVTLTVLPSGLVFGGGSVSFNAINGAPIPSQVVSFDTDNKISANWSATSNVGWLSASPTSGTTPATTVLAVNPGVGPLASNGYSGLLTLRAPGLADQALTVNLSLSPATLLASSNSLTLGGVYGRDFVTTQSLTLGLNTATNSWPWTLGGLPAWASASTTGGSINQAGASLVFAAKPSGAVLGTTSALVTATATVNGDLIKAPVLLTINKDRHKLLPSEIGVALSGTPTWTRLSRTLTVTDNYGAFGGMSASSSKSWLTAGVSGNKLTLTADPTTLLADSLNLATVTITPLDTDAVAPETIRVALWKGTLSPTANIALALPYSQVLADPIRPFVYVHNGGAYIDIYNQFSGVKVATLTGFSNSLGDMTTSSDGAHLFLHDIGNHSVTSIDLDTRLVNSQWALSASSDKSTRLKVIRPNGVEILLVSDGTAITTANGRRLAGLPLTAGTLAASGDGTRVLQQDEGNATVLQTTVASDYAELGGGTLYSAKVPAASHAGVGTLGQDIAVSLDGTRFYSASATPAQCAVLSPTDLGVLSYLGGGDSSPNNVEVGSDGRVFCGVAAKGGGTDVWVYDSGATTLKMQIKLAATGKQLQPRQMVISGDGLMLIGVTNDGVTTLVPLGL